MTAHRRPLFLSAAAAAMLLPACVTIQAQPSLPAPVEKREKSAAQARREGDQFASLRPGTVIPTNPAAKDTTTAQKPAGTDAIGEPIAPPPGGVKPAGDPPGPFPPIVTPPAPAEPTWLRVVRAHAEGRPEQALEALNKLEPPNQEMFLALVPILAK